MKLVAVCGATILLSALVIGFLSSTSAEPDMPAPVFTLFDTHVKSHSLAG